MRKLFLFGLILAFSHASVEAEQTLSSQLINAKTACCGHEKPDCRPRCLKGPKGSKGPKGDKGPRGKRGRTGPTLEINDILHATTRYTGEVGVTFVSFDPIVYSGTRINSMLPGGMTLVESVPLSNNFDTITLPKEDHDTAYSVTYGLSIGFPDGDFEGNGNFPLVLNENILNYTTIQIINQYPRTMVSRTNVIVNPAHTAGTLRVFSTFPGASLEPPTELGFSAYITIVKLNQNGT